VRLLIRLVVAISSFAAFGMSEAALDDQGLGVYMDCIAAFCANNHSSDARSIETGTCFYDRDQKLLVKADDRLTYFYVSTPTGTYPAKPPKGKNEELRTVLDFKLPENRNIQVRLGGVILGNVGSRLDMESTQNEKVNSRDQVVSVDLVRERSMIEFGNIYRYADFLARWRIKETLKDFLDHITFLQDSMTSEKFASTKKIYLDELNHCETAADLNLGGHGELRATLERARANLQSLQWHAPKESEKTSH
jgi:hypothetical protein